MFKRSTLFRRLLGKMRQVGSHFPGSAEYWESRYQAGHDSGQGSYGELANFKANTLNAIVAELGISSVIEFGCGDGNQLSLAQYPAYIGLDVSPTAITTCIKKFDGDRAKSFFLYRPEAFLDNHRRLSADASLSLDVIFHLVEDAVFRRYMTDLFAAADRYVIIYSSNAARPLTKAHVRHREFTSWVEESAAEWRLSRQIENPLKSDDDSVGQSRADFFVFERRNAS